jgi:hypothetical protein
VSFLACSFVLICSTACGANANRLTYLDEYSDPYYAGPHTAKLVTPQWVGDDQVDAVIALTIDDLRDVAKYEQFLRPIYDRLRQIDGRAPVSIFTNRVDPHDPRLQAWLKEGVSLEAHTVDHPCPCLQEPKTFAWSKATYDLCIDEMTKIPRQQTVAYRMPCCDSMPSVSPRFFSEIFNHTTPLGNFLYLDSSVMNVFTEADPQFDASVCRDEEGRLRFDKYLPRERGLWNWVENYPYPFVISKLCWEIPAATPDDWQGFNLQGKGHRDTIRDMKASLDATVTKQGVYTMLFHPHRWITNQQVNEVVDYATDRYGRKVKFLNMREIHTRLVENLLDGQPLRTASGGDNGVRLLDVNNDGYMDVVIGNQQLQRTKIWDPQRNTWSTCEFPARIVQQGEDGESLDAGVRFGILQDNGQASFLVRNGEAAGLWHFDGQQWVACQHALLGLEDGDAIFTARNSLDQGVRLRDLDSDGCCEVVVGNPDCRKVFRWTANDGFAVLPFSLPDHVMIVDDQGRDAGLRFVDLDNDRHDDLVFSNAERYSVHRFQSLQQGWGQSGIAGTRDDDDRIPPIIAADGTNNGVWFKFGHMWVQNEQTGVQLPQHCARFQYAQLLGQVPKTEAVSSTAP